MNMRGNKSSEAPYPNELFVVGAALVLGITGCAKIWSAFGGSKLLVTIDPILGVPFGRLLAFVGVTEVAIAVVSLFRQRSAFALGLIAWLSTNIVLYRLGLWWIGWKKPCSCLGNLTDALHIPPQLADNIMKVVLAYLLIGSYSLLIWQWRQSRKANGAVAAGAAPEPGN